MTDLRGAFALHALFLHRQWSHDDWAPQESVTREQAIAARRAALTSAACYWIHPGICNLIDHAGFYLPATHVLRATDLPTRTGIVVPADPLDCYWMDDDGEETHEAVLAVLWDSRGDESLLVEVMFDNPASVFGTYTFPLGRAVGDTGHVISWLVAFGLFVQQQILVGEQSYGPRALRRHDLAAAPTLQRTTVVTLRSKAPRPGAAIGDVPWSHRWVVSGHWREQFYPSENAHHTIWVDSYVKGPETLPLILKDRAFRVSR